MKAKKGDITHKLKIARGQIDGKIGRSIRIAGEDGAMILRGRGKAFLSLEFFLIGL